MRAQRHADPPAHGHAARANGHRRVAPRPDAAGRQQGRRRDHQHRGRHAAVDGAVARRQSGHRQHGQLGAAQAHRHAGRRQRHALCAGPEPAALSRRRDPAPRWQPDRCGQPDGDGAGARPGHRHPVQRRDAQPGADGLAAGGCRARRAAAGPATRAGKERAGPGPLRHPLARAFGHGARLRRRGWVAGLVLPGVAPRTGVARPGRSRGLRLCRDRHGPFRNQQGRIDVRTTPAAGPSTDIATACWPRRWR